MAKANEYIYDRAQKLLYENVDRNSAFEKYEEMDHNGWDLPPNIRALPWIRKVISSDPHDAIKSGVRILSTLPVSVKFQPLAPGLANRKRANMIEKNLKWQLASANQRRSKTVENQVSKSALLYDTVNAQVVDLDWQIKQKEFAGMSAKREKAMKRNFGRFMVKTHNPRDVYAFYSDVMLEAVLLRQYREIRDVVAEWGDELLKKHPELEEWMDDPEGSKVWYLDYVDLERRMVWLVPGKDLDDAARSFEVRANGVVIMDEENKLPFIPWVAMMGGDMMEDKPIHKYKPLLYSVLTSGAWETQNVVETLMVSEVIAHSGSPRFAETGPNPQSAAINYHSPERIAKVPVGNNLQQLQSVEIDRALQEVDALISAKIDKTTISSVLQGGDLPSGLAFATLNLATQTAVGALKPAKDLAEKSLAQMFVIMLLWVSFTGEDLYAYDAADRSEDYGAGITIEAKTIQPEAIYITCELHPDTPTDRQQKINAASMAVEALELPIEDALEEIGVEDALGAMQRRMRERLLQHRFQMRLDKERMIMEAEVQMMIQEQQMALQAQMQQQQAAQQFEMQQAAKAQESEMMMQGGGDNPLIPGGQAFNPNAGGQPSAANNPNLTRESVSGQDFMGSSVEQLAEGGL